MVIAGEGRGCGDVKSIKNPIFVALIRRCVITRNDIHKVTKVACHPFLCPSAYFPLTEQ